MNTTQLGQQAEAAAANFLVRKGFTVLVRNWRTRYCEIDIVACKRDTVYFAEVKYRSSERQGSGIDYITSQKLQRMRFAAEVWLHNNSWQGDAGLLAIEVGAAHTVQRAVFIAY